MTLPAAKPMPRPSAENSYTQENEHRYRRAIDDELGQKHDKRSDIRLGASKYLVFSATDGVEYGMGLDTDGYLTLTNYSTGDVSNFVLDIPSVAGLEQEFIDVRAEFASADGALTTAYVAADVAVAANAESANAALYTTISAEWAAADSTVASNAAALVASEASTRASADTAIAGTVTTLAARVTTNEGDITTLDATATAIDGRLATVEGDYATATSLSSLSATVSTNTGNISTNAAAITTESSARASGDSANASSITTLEAAYEKTTKQLIVDNFNNDGFYWTTAFGGAPESVADPANFSYGDVASIGRVAATGTFPRYLTPKSLIKPYSGMKLRVEAKVRATVNPTSGSITASLSTANGVDQSYANGAPSLTKTSVPGYASSEVGLTTSDGWVIIAAYLTCTGISTYDAGWRPRLNITNSGSGGTVQVAYFRIEDVTGVETVSAKVEQIAEAYATDSASTARLVWTVNAGTNVATLEQTAATGYADGTWNGSAISLTANEISLRADALNLGSDTTFESTHDTFYTISGSYRYRYGGPFGSSSNLLQWFGLNSVPLNSETKTNGVFAMATDGKVYFGSSPANSLTGASVSSQYVLGFASGAGSGTAGPVTVTPIGGDGTYTYAWTRINGSVLSATASTSATTSFSGTPGLGNLVENTFVCVVTETSTGRTAQVTVGAGVQSI